MVRVLFFAGARERAGTSAEELDLAGKSVGEARAIVGARHARLRDVLPLCRAAVDQGFVSDEHVLLDGCELALIPPVAGG